jgi:hypothetical protein
MSNIFLQGIWPFSRVHFCHILRLPSTQIELNFIYQKRPVVSGVWISYFISHEFSQKTRPIGVSFGEDFRFIVVRLCGFDWQK